MSSSTKTFVYYPTTVELNEIIKGILLKNNTLDVKGVEARIMKKKPNWIVPERRLIKFVKRQKAGLNIKEEDDRSVYSMRSTSSRKSTRTVETATSSSVARSKKDVLAKAQARPAPPAKGAKKGGAVVVNSSTNNNNNSKSIKAMSAAANGKKTVSSNSSTTSTRSTSTARSAASAKKTTTTAATATRGRSASVARTRSSSSSTSSAGSRPRSASVTTRRASTTTTTPALKKSLLGKSAAEEQDQELQRTGTDETESSNSMAQSIVNQYALYRDDNDGKEELCGGGCISHPINIKIPVFKIPAIPVPRIKFELVRPE